MELTNWIREGDLEALDKWFDDNADPSKDEYISNGVSIAHWAASAENTDILRLIITKLPSLVNYQNYEDGATPLHWAAQDNREKNISLLLARGANMLTDHMGETALHLASMNGFLGCAQLLCNADIVNTPSLEGNTALHLATLNSNKRIVAFLLSQGADPDLQNKKKETPRGIAGARKDKQLLDYFDPEKLKLLEEIEKAQDTNEELLGKTVDLKNAVEAEIRKREAAYTTIKLGEDKIAALEQDNKALQEQLTASTKLVAEKDATIEALRSALKESESRNSTLQSDMAASAAAAASAPLTARDFPSELVYSKVREAQAELQKLHKILEQSEHAILTTKTSINLLEESLSRP